MTKKVTVEDTVDFLIALSVNYSRIPQPTDNPRLSLADRKILENIRHYGWYGQDRGVTQKQRNLVLKILSKYLLLLKLHQWPMDDLLEPVWSSNLAAEILQHIHQVEFNSESNQYKLVFPYHKPTMSLLRQLHDDNYFLDDIQYVEDDHSWLIENGLQGRQLLKTLMKRDRYWCDELTRDQLNQLDTELVPTVSYLNGNWKIRNAQGNLLSKFDQIINTDDTVLRQTLLLRETGVIFDHTVKNVLRQWLTVDQLPLVCDPDPVIKSNQVKSLISLINQVNLWPVVLVTNKWDRGFSTDLELVPEWTKIRCPKPQGLTWDILQEYPSMLITSDVVYKTDMPANYLVPWMIHYKRQVNTERGCTLPSTCQSITVEEI